MQPAGAGMRRIREGQAWREILVVPSPVGLLSVGLAGKRHLHQSPRGLRVQGLPQALVLRALFKPAIQADSGRDLIAVRLIGWLQEGIAQPPGEYQIRSNAPGVLEIELGFVVPEISRRSEERRARKEWRS